MQAVVIMKAVGVVNPPREITVLNRALVASEDSILSYTLGRLLVGPPPADEYLSLTMRVIPLRRTACNRPARRRPYIGIKIVTFEGIYESKEGKTHNRTAGYNKMEHNRQVE